MILLKLFTLVLHSTVPLAILHIVHVESYTTIGEPVEYLISSKEIATKNTSNTGKVCDLLTFLCSNGHFTSAKVINIPSVVTMIDPGFILFFPICKNKKAIGYGLQQNKMLC